MAAADGICSGSSASLDIGYGNTAATGWAARTHCPVEQHRQPCDHRLNPPASKHRSLAFNLVERVDRNTGHRGQQGQAGRCLAIQVSVLTALGP